MAPSTAMQSFLVLLCLASAPELFTVIHGQQVDSGFISLDCGIAADRSYSDPSTSGLRYVSDAGFSDAGAGLNASVAPPYDNPGMADRYSTVRYFPDGNRSCYTLRPVTPGGKYLVRVSFYYGDYDGNNRPPVFDLHLGVNRWATVNVTAADERYILEAVVVSPADFFQVCLVNTGLGTPFISGLDLRPLKWTMYPEATINQSLLLLTLSRPSATFGFNRYQFWPLGYPLFRYPFDPYDRLWQRYGTVAAWNNITTSATVDVSDVSSFDKSTDILRSAATPVNGTRIDFAWGPDSFVNNDNATYLLMLYFAELQRLPSNTLRQFDILVDNATWNGSQGVTPKYLSAQVVKRMVKGSGQHTVTLAATTDATLPPIINAFEIYSVNSMTEVATNDADAKAMMAIRTKYALKKNWMGDPCAPKEFTWDDLNCSYPPSGPASVTTLQLSSSGLSGVVDASFSDLKSLQHLDLSNNSLSGSIPNFLAQMPSLRYLDLSNNKLSGRIPADLLEKNTKGSLVLRFCCFNARIDNNANLCGNNISTCEVENKKSNKILVIATVIPIAVATLLFVAAFIMLHRMRKRQDKWMANPSSLNSPRDRPTIFENRQFTYKELKLITSNFREEIGRGGFGGVFLGYLEDGSPVAVKMRSKTSSQGDKEFLAEAQHLSRVHHRNLVSLIGFCKDKKHLALVYEFMYGGNLEDRLRGEAAAATPLTWHQRLKIALDSAHGLEYLHKSCQPPLIHRDVKTRNILLSADLEAKIADFGLMKAFANEFVSHVTTMPAGTLGYLDPEYYNTSQLSEKSDVYSFGVVLLELITGQPPAVTISNTESIHIALWVRQKLSEGDITSIADPRMGGKYDVNSVWKVAELALQCKEEPSRKRPTMTDVVVELKECLELEPDSPGFISIDCGIADDAAYNDPNTRGLLHIPDTNYTDAGQNGGVRPPHDNPNWPKVYRTLRYFLDGERSCYTLRPVVPGGRYLVRARFYYGNYDGKNSLPVFDIHIGVNRWTTVNITSPGGRHTIEAVTVSPADFLQICLVKTGSDIPFISGLELRPLEANMYPEATANKSLLLLRLARPTLTDYSSNRYHFWTTGFFRYPIDLYDRSWQSYKDPAWTNITTTATVDVTNISNFDRPNKILQSAATPKNGTRMDFSWSPDPDLNDYNTTYLLLLYFAELQRLPMGALRQFDILVDNATWDGSQSYTPKYLSAEVVKTMVQGSSQHAVSIVATPDATLSPILNAFEIYSVKPMTELATNDADAKAMMTIRRRYELKKNWMGDPCAPKSFAWDGLNCSYPSSGPASVTDLNLSNNNIFGPIPDFLAQMPSLKGVDLSSNNLSGLVPAALVEKSRNRSLVLRIENNPNLCTNGASMCKSEKKKSSKTLVTAIVVPVAVALLLLLFVAAFIIFRTMKNKRDIWMANNLRFNSPRERSNIFENRQFTYKDLKLITANFREEIGRGGFGGVFLGYLENGNPVAVKMRSKTSCQGDKEFLAEAQHLGRVHHRSLVSLIGYCKDKKHLALVYEYMHGGNLEDCLRGDSATVTPLTWRQRLKIALNSAHGLEYLHKSCQPPLIHRDVKTRNILLSADLEAKIADFGLMKAFANESMSHVTTMPAGTLGYLDPEYYHTFQLSEKSDVYSFGVVLLELITGQSPAVPISDTESIHIAQWVRQKLSEGDIASVADPRMGEEYDVNSVWKVAELALQCKEEPSRKRPTMTDVVVELKECLELEISHIKLLIILDSTS
ncbi:hypothetical protein QOZ80_5AG0394430 [Eleusine coracana subsp. coracana]|nr:hypothetical protein QOZ80_5AG0394430 [Eleusine coracana subsp. coracana]